MKGIDWRKMALLALLTAVTAPGNAAAAALSLFSGGDGRFIIRGEGLERIGGIDLTVGYDATSLANPTVSTGELTRGALLADNTAMPGTVRIAILQARGGISGSGTIATIAFDAVSPGGGATLQAQLVDMKGQNIAAAVTSFVTAGSLPAQDASTATSSGLDKGGIRSSGWPGSITLEPGQEPGKVPGEARKPVDEASPQKPAVGVPEGKGDTSEFAPGDEGKGESPAPAAIKMPSKLIVHQGVIDRFKEFRGEMTLKALTDLFSDLSLKGFRQNPPVAIADGKSPVTLTICSELAGPEITSFALTGATLAKLRKDESDCFLLDILPDKAGEEVMIRIVSAAAVHQIPLAVAPAIDGGKGTPLTERDFSLFLKGEGKYASLLKGRGEQYFRNFIFTANYLAKKQKEPAPPAPQRGYSH